MPSPRRAELLDACYAYVLEHGLIGLTLRPLAAATGTSPRVLLYLFGAKDDLVRELLARARHEQMTLMASALDARAGGFEALIDRLWTFLTAPRQRPAVRLTYEAFLLSLSHNPGPWTDFAAESVRDWLGLLIDAQPDVPRQEAETRATRALALLRGLLLDLLTSGDDERVESAMTVGF
jgi:AcrR family transcriptional regulator